MYHCVHCIHYKNERETILIGLKGSWTHGLHTHLPLSIMKSGRGKKLNVLGLAPAVAARIEEAYSRKSAHLGVCVCERERERERERESMCVCESVCV